MNKILFGDCRASMRELISDGVKVQMCVTSPPYFGLRDYGCDGQMGLEKTPEEYITNMVETFRLVRELLADDGTLWLNIGDSYANSGTGGHGKTGGLDKSTLTSAAPFGACPTKKTIPNGMKQKDLIGIPWMLAFALRADGWYLRQDIIWAKPNPMPESVRDRCTKSHEYIFLLSKSPKYFYDSEAGAEPITDSSAIRLLQKNLENQNGSERVPGKTNGNMKAVGRKPFDSSMGGGGTSWVGHSGYKKADGTLMIKPTRNRRSVWTVTTKPYRSAHFATFPKDLIQPCILMGSRLNDTVFDPFMGSGTTAEVALERGRQYLGCELNQEYGKLIEQRLQKFSSQTEQLVLSEFD